MEIMQYDNTETAYEGVVTTMKTNMFEVSRFVKWSVTGDGYVGRGTNNKDAHYAISRSPQYADYLDVIEGKLAGLPDCRVRRSTYVRKDNGKEVHSLITSSHPLFSRIRDRQYIDGKRVIDPHMLTTINWEVLAFLYMDDGSLCHNIKGSPIVRISTCAYSYFEQMALRRAFVEKLGTVFNVNKARKGLYQLCLAKKSHDEFFENITPFIVPSYRYKLPASLQREAPSE